MTDHPRPARKHQFRAVMCGHKAVEAGGVCVVLMVQGHLAEVTAAHFLVATKTGLIAIVPVLAVTMTRYARVLVNRWAASALLGVCTCFADALVHGSHYPGAYTEAALTGVGACIFSIVVSYTAVGRYIDRLGEEFVRSPA